MKKSQGGIEPKAIIILILIGVGCVVFLNYKKTGQWTLFPEERTAKEQKLFELERELAKINKELKGMDTSLANATATGDDIYYHEKKILTEKKLVLEEELKRYQAMVKKEQEESGKIPK